MSKNADTLLSVYLVFSLIVGNAVILVVIAAAFFWPATRFFKKVVNKMRDWLRGEKAVEYVGWNALFESGEKIYVPGELPAVGGSFDETMDAINKAVKTAHDAGLITDEELTRVTEEEMPGLAHFRQAPLVVRHDDPEFGEKTTQLRMM